MNTHEVGGRVEESSFTDEISFKYDKAKLSEEVESSNQQNFQLREPRSSTKKMRKLRARNTMDQRSGHWTAEQNRKYYLFLEGHHMNFEKKNLRRSEKIFKVMSRFLGTRTADQCRSHHQKMEKKCLTFEKILQFLSENITDTNPISDGGKPSSAVLRRECVQRVARTETMASGSQPVKELETAQITQQESEQELIMPSILIPCYQTIGRHHEMMRILHFNKPERTVY